MNNSHDVIDGLPKNFTHTREISKTFKMSQNSRLCDPGKNRGRRIPISGAREPVERVFVLSLAGMKLPHSGRSRHHAIT